MLPTPPSQPPACTFVRAGERMVVLSFRFVNAFVFALFRTVAMHPTPALLYVKVVFDLVRTFFLSGGRWVLHTGREGFGVPLEPPNSWARRAAADPYPRARYPQVLLMLPQACSCLRTFRVGTPTAVGRRNLLSPRSMSTIFFFRHATEVFFGVPMAAQLANYRDFRA